MYYLNFMQAYINTIFCINIDIFTDYISKLQDILNHLKKAGFEMNLKKSFGAKINFKYLGYEIMHGGINSVMKKV